MSPEMIRVIDIIGKAVAVVLMIAVCVWIGHEIEREE